MNNKLILIYMVVIGCFPPLENKPTSDKGDIDLYSTLEDCDPCPLLLNFASSNYQN
ncbi:uncharacterized protein METZ01_LOCUS396001, partial [marine metagenome]